MYVLFIQSYRQNQSFCLQTDRHNNLCLSVSYQLLGTETVFGCIILYFLRLKFYFSWRHCNLGFKVNFLLICLLCNGQALTFWTICKKFSGGFLWANFGCQGSTDEFTHLRIQHRNVASTARISVFSSSSTDFIFGLMKGLND